jgi:hypothetical protein
LTPYSLAEPLAQQKKLAWIVNVPKELKGFSFSTLFVI